MNKELQLYILRSIPNPDWKVMYQITRIRQELSYEKCKVDGLPELPRTAAERRQQVL